METKKCTKCGNERTLDDFRRNGRIRKSTGTRNWSSWCNPCHRSYNRERYRNDPKYRALILNRDKVKARNERLLRVYGISAAEYDVIFTNQRGQCKICGEKAKTKRLSIDHDHDTGRIRGLLCNNCNAAVGFLKDDPKLARNIIKYLGQLPAL